MALAAALFPASAQTGFQLRPYHAEYVLLSDGEQRGNGERWLLQLDDDLWKVHSSSKASYLFLSDKRVEESIFLSDTSGIYPLQYSYERTGTGTDREYLISFDHPQDKLTEHKGKDEFKATWVEGIKDGVTYQVAIRKHLFEGSSEFEFPIIVKGKNKNYRFRLVGEEKLKLPAGTLNTVKLERVRSKKKRQTFIWVIPEYDYTIARIQQIYKGSEQFDLQLSQFNWLESQLQPKYLAELKSTARRP